MFGFNTSAGFGASQPQQSPFGAAPSSPFGTTTFGQQAPAFGATASAAPFGASQPAFGAASTPAFGAASTPAFGGLSTFGQAASNPAFGGFGQTSAFGAASTPAFGATGFGAASTPAFGLASTPAFGASSTPAFGAPASTMSIFGATSAPAFGAASTSPFGATSTFGATAASNPFGASTTFGAAGSPFGAASTPGFGAASSAAAFGATATGAFGGFGAVGGQAATGTRQVPFQKTQDRDASAAGGSNAQQVNFNHICAMQQYQGKSVEELRWEDYSAGVKGNTGAAPGAAQPLAGTTSFAFGGQQQQATSAPFGASTSPFGTSSLATSPFGASSAAAFGAASTPSFGGGGLFGASSAAFGASTPSGFGAQTGFGASTGFGVQSSAAPGFGNTPAFGAAGSTPAFGAASTPGFGFPASSAGFGATQTTGTFGSSPFGGTSLFGSTTTTSQPFGGGTSLFGAAQPKPFGAASTPASTPSLFGAASTPSLFGAATGSSFGFNTGGTFGTTTTPGGSLFNQGGSIFATGALTTTQPTGGLFSTATPQQQLPPPGVAQAPYGSFQQLPTVVASEPKVGITQRSSNSSTLTISRTSPLLRSSAPAPRFGIQIRSSSAISRETPTTPAASPPPAGMTPEGVGVLPSRENPHRLFIRARPPSTDSPLTSSMAPPMTARDTTPGGANADQGVTPARRLSVDVDQAATPASQNGHHTNGTAANGSSSRDTPLPRLGQLAGKGYSYQPGATQLRAMYEEDPDSLAAVSNFKVEREGCGAIRWLVPVDVRGLDLEGAVSIGQGEVTVYGGEIKPPQGEGLNQPAEITLLGCYRMNKATGFPIREGPQAVAYEKKLRKHCAENDTRFISYRVEGGIWKFQVDHFSRYGVPDSDSDDEEGMEDAAAGGVGGGEELVMEVSMGMPWGAAAGGEAGVPEGNGTFSAAASDLHAQMQEGSDHEDEEMEGGDGEAYSSLPAQGLATGGTPLDLGQALAAAGGHPSTTDALRQSLFAGAEKGEGLRQGPGGQGAGVRGPAGLRTAWKAAASPLVGVLDRSRLRTQHTLGITPPPTPRFPALTPPTSTAATAEAAPPSTLVDAALLMGRSFRVGWGPGGVLVYPDNLGVFQPGKRTGGTDPTAGEGEGGSVAGSPPRDLQPRALDFSTPGEKSLSPPTPLLLSAPPTPSVTASRRPSIVLTHLPLTSHLPCAPNHPAAVEHLRTRVEAALKVHKKHSVQVGTAGQTPDGQPFGQTPTPSFEFGQTSQAGQPSPSGGQTTSGSSHGPVPPFRQLQCDKSELLAVVTRELNSAVGGAARGRLGSWAAEGVKHEVQTWELVRVLWRKIEGEEAAAAVGGGEDVAMEEGEEEEEPSSRLVALLQRKADLSAWLRNQCASAVKQSLRSASSRAQVVALLLTGHRLEAAAAAAAASGDRLLSTLIPRLGKSSLQKAALGAALRTWASSRLEARHLPADLSLLYRLLSGDMLAVQPQLPLTWHQSLGMFFWYHSPPNTPIKDATWAYSSAFSSTPGIPPPLPPHASSPSSRTSLAAPPTDIQYELLRLHGQEEPVDGERLGVLLRAGGVTSNPVDVSTAWQLMSLLTAIGAVEVDLEDPNVVSKLTTLYSDFLALLQSLPSLSHWAVYVALHLPDVPCAPGLRLHALRPLLHRYYPQWQSSPSHLAFLRKELNIPEPLLAESQVLWARTKRVSLQEVRALIAAQQYKAAHVLLYRQVAPLLLLVDAASISELRKQLQLLLVLPADEYTGTDEMQQLLGLLHGDSGAGNLGAYAGREPAVSLEEAARQLLLQLLLRLSEERETLTQWEQGGAVVIGYLEMMAGELTGSVELQALLANVQAAQGTLSTSPKDLRLHQMLTLIATTAAERLLRLSTTSSVAAADFAELRRRVGGQLEAVSSDLLEPSALSSFMLGSAAQLGQRLLAVA